MDGVIAASHIPVLKEVGKKYHIPIKYSDLILYDTVSRTVADKLGPKYCDEAKNIWFDPVIARQSPPTKEHY